MNAYSRASSRAFNMVGSRRGAEGAENTEVFGALHFFSAPSASSAPLREQSNVAAFAAVGRIA